MGSIHKCTPITLNCAVPVSWSDNLTTLRAHPRLESVQRLHHLGEGDLSDLICAVAVSDKFGTLVQPMGAFDFPAPRNTAA